MDHPKRISKPAENADLEIPGNGSAFDGTGYNSRPNRKRLFHEL